MTNSRTTNDPVPLPSSPGRAETLAPETGAGGDGDVKGIPGTLDSGLGAKAADDDERRATAGARAAGNRAKDGDTARPATEPGTPPATPPTDDVSERAERNRDDGPLDSFGKAVVAPVRDAPRDDPAAPDAPKDRSRDGG